MASRLGRAAELASTLLVLAALGLAAASPARAAPLSIRCVADALDLPPAPAEPGWIRGLWNWSWESLLGRHVTPSTFDRERYLVQKTILAEAVRSGRKPLDDWTESLEGKVAFIETASPFAARELDLVAVLEGDNVRMRQVVEYLFEKFDPLAEWRDKSVQDLPITEQQEGARRFSQYVGLNRTELEDFMLILYLRTNGRYATLPPILARKLPASTRRVLLQHLFGEVASQDLMVALDQLGLLKEPGIRESIREWRNRHVAEERAIQVASGVLVVRQVLRGSKGFGTSEVRPGLGLVSRARLPDHLVEYVRKAGLAEVERVMRERGILPQRRNDILRLFAEPTVRDAQARALQKELVRHFGAKPWIDAVFEDFRRAWELLLTSYSLYVIGHALVSTGMYFYWDLSGHPPTPFPVPVPTVSPSTR